MFLVRLFKIEDKVIKDNNGKKVTFKVAHFGEYGDIEGIFMQTGVNQKKWFRYDDEESIKEYNSLGLKLGDYYKVTISFEFKIVKIEKYLYKEKKE